MHQRSGVIFAGVAALIIILFIYYRSGVRTNEKQTGKLLKRVSFFYLFTVPFVVYIY